MIKGILNNIFWFGNKERITIYYHKGGPKQMEGTMKNGKSEGLWVFWGEDGNINLTETYKNGELIVKELTVVSTD